MHFGVMGIFPGMKLLSSSAYACTSYNSRPVRYINTYCVLLMSVGIIGNDLREQLALHHTSQHKVTISGDVVK